MRWLSDDGECAIVRETRNPVHFADHLPSNSFEIVSTKKRLLNGVFRI